MQLESPPMKKVVIQSIGMAHPSVSNLIAESFGYSQDIVLRMLYKAPSVLLEEVEEELAFKTKELLDQLGLHVDVIDPGEFRKKPGEELDISIYLTEVARLPEVLKQLEDFLGCEKQVALNLLCQEPAVVLGGVSKSTAEAFAQRVNVESVITNPKKDFYTLLGKKVDPLTLSRLKKDHPSLQVEDTGKLIIKDLNYDSAQKLWKQFHAHKEYVLINQSHQRRSLVLQYADVNNPKHLKVLTEEVGMPREIVPVVLENLPITLFESLNMVEADHKQEHYQSLGMSCAQEANFPCKCQLIVLQISDNAAFNDLMATYFPGEILSVSSSSWKSKPNLPTVMAEYVAYRLESISCEVEVVKNQDF